MQGNNIRWQVLIFPDTFLDIQFKILVVVHTLFAMSFNCPYIFLNLLVVAFNSTFSITADKIQLKSYLENSGGPLRPHFANSETAAAFEFTKVWRLQLRLIRVVR